MKTLMRFIVVPILILSFLQFICLAQDTKPSFDFSRYKPVPATYEQAMLARFEMEMQTSSPTSRMPAPANYNKNRHWKRNITLVIIGGGLISGAIALRESKTPEYSFRDITTSNTLKDAGSTIMIGAGSGVAGAGILGMIIGY
jgi:hypothetical protein